MVFQNYALWPHMSVFDNVAYGLRRAKAAKEEIRRAVAEALRMIGLPDIAERRVSELSGGQQQRVALARALAPRPKVVLFDEPLSNIDTRLRESMRLEVLRLQQETGVTVVWVTHDQEEALSMSSRIVVMNAGLVEQIGRPEEVWDSPSSEYVAEFMGSKNLLRGAVSNATAGGPSAVRITEKEVLSLPEGERPVAGTEVVVCVSAADIDVAERGTLTGENVLSARVLSNRFHGDSYQLSLEVGTTPIRASSRRNVVGTAEHVDIRVPAERITLLSAAHKNAAPGR